MNGFIPGSYRCTKDGKKIISPVYGLVAKLAYAGVRGNPYTDEARAATARLLAAAPDMFELCEAILRRLDLEAEERPGETFPCAAVRSDLRAVIAKVKGERS